MIDNNCMHLPLSRNTNLNDSTQESNTVGPARDTHNQHVTILNVRENIENCCAHLQISHHLRA
jgi:hypothetical protein